MVHFDKACQWLGAYPQNLEKEIDADEIKTIDGEKYISQELLDDLILKQDKRFEKMLNDLTLRYEDQIERAHKFDEWVSIDDHLTLAMENVVGFNDKSRENRKNRIIKLARDGELEYKEKDEILLNRQFTIDSLEKKKQWHFDHISREWDQIKSMRTEEPLYELSEKAKEVLPKELQDNLLASARRATVTHDGTSLVVCLDQARKYLEDHELFS